ncbi:MAG: hypothetical protein HC913_16925 [Microscillaceae bacterium]|nr:hypothetical protein [Microscillaceae bacterium]
MEVFHLIFRPEVIVFFVPISAIVGGIYLASLRIKAKMMENSLSNADVALLKKVSQENNEIKERLQNLEAIVTTLDKDLLLLGKSQPDLSAEDADKIKALAKKLKPE